VRVCLTRFAGDVQPQKTPEDPRRPARPQED
jgi:hypothetical protein